MGLFAKLRSTLMGQTSSDASAVSEGPTLVRAPVSGRLVALGDVPDPLFSEGLLGDGFGIWPSEDCVVAPIRGRVAAVVDSRHAIGLMAPDGTEVLVHVGVDTVEMMGEGFAYHVGVGDVVDIGDPLLSFDREKIRADGHADVVMLIFPGTSSGQCLHPLVEPGEVTRGDGLCTLEAARS